MRHAWAIGHPRGSSEPLSSDLKSNNTFAIPAMGFTNRDSVDGGSPGASALAVGLTPLPGGDREAADTGAQAAGEASPPGGPDSPLVFDVAAVLCGHDITSEVGKANARADYRVWDLVERMRP